MDRERDSQPLGSHLSSGTAFPDNLEQVVSSLVLQFPQTQTQGVCHRPPSQSRLREEPCMIVFTDAARHGHENVNIGTVPAEWDGMPEVTGSRDRAYGRSSCQLGCLYPCEGNSSAV